MLNNRLANRYKKKKLIVSYEFIPASNSKERISEVYEMLFGEIQDLINQETINNCNNKYVQSKTT